MGFKFCIRESVDGLRLSRVIGSEVASARTFLLQESEFQVEWPKVWMEQGAVMILSGCKNEKSGKM